MPLHWQLGLLAGITIFLGLPIAVMPNVQNRARAFLTSLSTGILIFLLIEILGKVLEEVEEVVEHAGGAAAAWQAVVPAAGLLIAGVALGLLGLVWFERTFTPPPGVGPSGRRSPNAPPTVGTAGGGVIAASAEAPSSMQRARQLALMIAIGIGLHNFGEGLAIGQEHAVGATRMAWLLAIGFGLHNAAEGFGIAAPLAGQQTSLGFLGVLGLIGGGPTLLGAVLGGVWASEPTELFCLSLAGGTILYVIGELLHVGRQLKNEVVAHIGLLTGFFLAFATELLIHFH